MGGEKREEAAADVRSVPSVSVVSVGMRCSLPSWTKLEETKRAGQFGARACATTIVERLTCSGQSR